MEERGERLRTEPGLPKGIHDKGDLRRTSSDRPYPAFGGALPVLVLSQCHPGTAAPTTNADSRLGRRVRVCVDLIQQLSVRIQRKLSRTADRDLFCHFSGG